MVREVLTVSCGQAGIQLGDVIWRQCCADDGSFRCFFEETNGRFFARRNLSVDLEPNVIDEIRGDLFHSEFLLKGKEDAANTFARGHYSR